MLKNNGYQIKVLNLLEMEKSNCYNPFYYIREETDIIKLITNLMANTTPKDSSTSDPFWEKSESLFLQAIFYYVWMEEPAPKKTFETVLRLIGEAEVVKQGKSSLLDQKMQALAERSPLGKNHPAVKQYNKCMRGAGDTVRSIIISANARLAFLENQQVLRLLSKDEMNLAEIGIGINGDKTKRTVLFCVIPDADKSYNFLVGLLYTQVFQELYYQADFVCNGRLPIHVTLLLDEFANVALPDDFCSLLSTMRGREISSVIIIQNLAQIKALFKDTWESLPGNCDTLIYLGGNEKSTHQYISELLGKATIDKRSMGETRGRQGSASRNYDVLGRELLTPDEVRKLDNKKCLIFIRGFQPILDAKFNPFRHPRFKQTADGEGNAYVHLVNRKENLEGKKVELLSKESLSYYERRQKAGDSIHMNVLSYQEALLLKKQGMQPVKEEKQKKPFTYATALPEVEHSEAVTKELEQGKELEYVPEAATNQKAVRGEKEKEANRRIRRRLLIGEDSITNRITTWSYTEEQLTELTRAIEAGVRDSEILSYFYPETSVEEMRKYLE